MDETVHQNAQRHFEAARKQKDKTKGAVEALENTIIELKRANKKEKGFLKKMFKGSDGNENNFILVRELLFKYNCIQDTLTRANHFADVAIDSLSIFPDNKFKKAFFFFKNKFFF